MRLPDFDPRPYQLKFLAAMDGGCKRACLVWHRRAGKEIVCFNWMVKQAFWHRVGTYVYFFPTSSLGRRILWDGMDKNGRRFLDYIPPSIIAGKPNSVDMKIKLTNGSTIQIMGTDQILNVGVNPIGCVFSEYSLQDPRSWNFTRPILRENGGWAIFNFTPRGKNHAYDLYLMAKHNPNWFSQLLSINDTRKADGTSIITLEDIEEERKEGMSEHLIQQEYYCSFDQGAEGAYYAKYLNRAEIEGRLTNVVFDPLSPVNTYFDLGVGDETVILFTQNIGQQIHLIDMYRNHGEGLNHYARILQEKAEANNWVYGDHCAPHDIRVRELGSGAQTRLDIARELGINFIIVPNLPIAEGIELARGIWPRLWIDSTKCLFFIKAAENYHKHYNEKLNVYSDRPVHDWSSHCFVGETKIWTSSGMQRIKDLPKSGLLRTLYGWKKYYDVRVTRKNAQLVEVRFQDGTTVRCTLDHLFLTEKGWKYAKDLRKGTKIQSSSTLEPNILKENYTDFGRAKSISQRVVKNCIELFGPLHLEKFPQNVISTIKTGIHLIIDCTILNAWIQKSMQNLVVKPVLLIKGLLKRDKKRLESGIPPRLEEFGIADMRRGQKLGLNGKENHESAYTVKKNSNVLSEEMATSKNFAIPTAKECIIESVSHLKQTEDVWCLTVPEAEHFCLENGAVVHNCMDAFRMMAIMQNKRRGGGMSEEDADKMQDLYFRRMN